jgi:hypothetical protein
VIFAVNPSRDSEWSATEVAPKVKELMEGVTLAIDHYKAGGYDRETWHRICDGLSREAMSLMMVLSGPAHPYMARGGTGRPRAPRRARAGCARHFSSRLPRGC